jgi:hypothetical protein
MLVASDDVAAHLRSVAGVGVGVGGNNEGGSYSIYDSALSEAESSPGVWDYQRLQSFATTHVASLPWAALPKPTAWK